MNGAKALVLSGVVALAAWAAGCAIDATSNTHGRCTVDGDCASADLTCYRGFCVPKADGSVVVDGGMDGGSSPDTGVDAGPDSGLDTGPQPDTGVDGGPDTGLDAPAPMDMGTDTSPDANTWCDAAMAPCSTGQLGECAGGHIGCGTLGSSCERDHDPVPEICDDLDQDCDGIVDEEADGRCYPPSPTIGCTRNADGSFTCVGTCRTGTQTCMTGGNPGPCTGDVTPNVDGCQAAGTTGLDEDCDGMVDEDCTCSPGSSRSCFDGPAALAGIGRCVRGSQACDTGGHWGACNGSGAPMAESCGNSGADDDCDGTVDNVPGIGVACTVSGGVGDCGDGTTQCNVSGMLTCSAPGMTSEICDHHDNDCDASTDEDFDLSSDDANCGACGNACGAGTSCCNGRCVDPSSDEMACGMCTTTCGAGDTCCSASCVDTQTDELNCGTCGNACSGGRLCCGGRCVDPLADATNCMTCGHACGGSTTSCCGGVCHLPSDGACTGCPVNCSLQTPVQQCCGTSCADTMTDEANCGTCGHACTAGQVCCGGTCQTNDARHCGGACADCGTGLCCSDACVPIDTRHCQSCGVSCASGSTCCGDGCHDLASSDANCGGCGAACTGTTPHCTNSHCCANGRTWCGSSCVNTATDSNNCGTCGHACGALSSCTAGMCHLL